MANMAPFIVTGHSNKIPGMVFTDVNIPTQFNVTTDPRIDKSTHWISVMLTLDANPKTVVKPCKLGTTGIHKQIPENTYFYTDDKILGYNWKTEFVEKANPPTIHYPLTETMMLKFQCLNSCQGARHARMFLIFRLHDGEQNVLAQSEVEIKVIKNHVTKEKEAAKAGNECSKGKRKGDHLECSVAGGTDVHLRCNKKLKPGLKQMIEEAYAKAKTAEEWEVLRMCIKNCLNQIAAAEPATKTENAREPLERRSSPYIGVQESGHKLCEIKLTILEKMKDPLRQQVEALYAGSMALADQSNCAMLRRLREENIVSIEGATSLNCQPVPVMDDSVEQSAMQFPVDRSMCCTATGEAADQDTLVTTNLDNAEQCVNGDGEFSINQRSDSDAAVTTYTIVPFSKIAVCFTDENNKIEQLAVLEEDTLIYNLREVSNYDDGPDTGLRNAEALLAFGGRNEDMTTEPDG